MVEGAEWHKRWAWVVLQMTACSVLALETRARRWPWRISCALVGCQKKKKKSDLDRRRLGAKFVALRMRMLFCCGDNERERDVKRKSPVC